MCQYIKDDGEQCGRTAEPFCHDHDDTKFAALYRLAAAADEGEGATAMDTTCTRCEQPLRRRERLTAHPNVDRAVLFEAYVECDCSEHVLGATSVSITEVPDGW